MKWSFCSSKHAIIINVTAIIIISILKYWFKWDYTKRLGKSRMSPARAGKFQNDTANRLFQYDGVIQSFLREASCGNTDEVE